MNLDDSVQLAIASLKQGGLSDITKEALELRLIAEFEDYFVADVIANLKRSSIDQMNFGHVQYILAPKNRYVFDYRKAAIIQPADVVKFAALVFQFAHQVEAARVPAAKNIVFSYRFTGKDGEVFDSKVGFPEWLAENQRIRECDDVEFVVSCDIAAFYDRINIHRIESTLLATGVAKSLVKKVNDLLLFWSRRDSYGLPVGNVASRILAEVALIDIDEYLLSEGVRFTRYVDDYKLFAPDLITAQKWMNKLTIRLFRDGLMLNTGKTKVTQVSPKEESPESSAPEDAEQVLKVITSLTGGYNRIARKFIMPADEKHALFAKIDVAREIETLESQALVEFSGIQKVVIACLVKREFEHLARIAELCKKYLYGLDYFVDMLIKNAEFIPPQVKEQLADYYQELVTGPEYTEFEWHCATLAILLSNPGYFRKRALLHLFQTSGKEVSTYPSMIALEGLAEELTRSEFRTIREYFGRCDEWEKRRLAYASRALPQEERAAWAKSVKATVADDVLCARYLESIAKGKAI